MPWIIGLANDEEIDLLRKKGHGVEIYKAVDIIRKKNIPPMMEYDQDSFCIMESLVEKDRVVCVAVDVDIPDIMSNQWDADEITMVGIIHVDDLPEKFNRLTKIDDDNRLKQLVNIAERNGSVMTLKDYQDFFNESNLGDIYYIFFYKIDADRNVTLL